MPAEERVSMSHAEPAPRERRRADLDFEIILTSTSADGPDSFAPRSRLEGNQIVVNVSHPDFVERLKKTRVGKETFDSRLLSYLAAIVSAHYRDLTYQQLGSRPESCSDMLDCYGSSKLSFRACSYLLSVCVCVCVYVIPYNT